MWAKPYHDLTEGQTWTIRILSPVALEPMCSAVAHLRLARLLEAIRVEHLRAALAVWRYCEQPARYIWGDALGDSTADELLRALRAAGGAGMTKWDITNHFSRHK